MRSEDLSFEEAYTRLEETVRTLEAGGLTLNESMNLYEHGMNLARICNQLLSNAEVKITRLQREFGEQISMLEDGSDEQ